MVKNKNKNMKYLKTFESYTFEDFTHSDMEDVKELLEEMKGSPTTTTKLKIKEIKKK